jgi:steroid delta-isomerase-like uncharacterized protein
MHTPSPEANIDVIRTACHAFNATDIDACLARIAPSLVMHLAGLPEPLHGRDAWREGFTLIKQAFPDLHVHIEDMLAAEDQVAVRLTLHGTHTGEYLGFAPTGRPISYVSHEFYRLDHGLVAEEWICSDAAGLFQQIS